VQPNASSYEHMPAFNGARKTGVQLADLLKSFEEIINECDNQEEIEAVRVKFGGLCAAVRDVFCAA